ncbi:MAG TPA: hypothetical protein DCS42_04895 [Nitrospiraceae bacterium]|nr:hypothetical protein [Nitrospiraceae bacterium]
MGKVIVSLLLVLGIFVPLSASAAEWDLKANTRRLESVAPDYKNDKDIDKKFLDILNLTETTKKSSEIYVEAKRIAENAGLAQSKYMDSFLYYMFVRSLGLYRTGTTEADFWLGQLKSFDKSHHLLAARLLRMKLLPKNSPDVRNEAAQIVQWLQAQKPEFRVRAPEYTGTLFLGTKPRQDFVKGEAPKTYVLSYYRGSADPLAGFQDDETYVSLLDRIKSGREDVMNEMVTLYRKKDKKAEAAGILYELAMLKVSVRDLAAAKTLLESAVKLNPELAGARQQLDKIKLELAYQSVAPPKTETPVAEGSSAIPEHLYQETGYLTPADRVLSEAELHGRSAGELRAMRNEVYARYGRTFDALDLQEYFSRKPWYRQSPTYSDSALSEIDRENVRIIQDFENRAVQ